MKYYIIHNALFLAGGFVLYTFIQCFIILWLSALITMTIVTAIGVWKERRDKKGGGIFDWWDLACDELGGTLGILVSIYMISKFNL